jgi:hypothetical protein
MPRRKAKAEEMNIPQFPLAVNSTASGMRTIIDV